MAACRTYLPALGVEAALICGCEGKRASSKKPDREKSSNRDASPSIDSLSTDAAAPARPAIAQVAVGNRHVCALTEEGAVHCWGSGDHGRLGYGNTDAIGDDEPASAAGPGDELHF